MASAFGVQLRKSDGSSDSTSTRTPGGARRSDFKSKPVSDLKVMFDKPEGADPKKRVVNSSVDLSDQKYKIANKTKTNSAAVPKQNSEILSKDEKQVFENLRCKLNKAGIESLLEADKPTVAVAKTYSGGQSYTATVEKNKVQNSQENESTKVVTKSDAVAALSFGLTKIRTRPGNIKTEDDKVPKNESKDMGFTKCPSSPNLRSSGADLTGKKELGKGNRYMPGTARGWKSSVENKDENKSTGKFVESSVGKIREEVKSEPKIKGFRSVSPIDLGSNSSDNSSSSANLSPRGYKPNYLNTQSSETKKDINENIRKFETSKSDSNLLLKDNTESEKTITKNGNKDWKSNLTKSKPKHSTVEQRAIETDIKKSNRNSGSFSSDSEKGKSSPRNKSGNTSVEKSKLSLDEVRQQTRLKSQGHRPLSRASSSGSNSSLTRLDDRNIRSKISRFDSPEPGDDRPTNSLETVKLRQRNMAVSRKITPEKFQDLKKGFENKSPRTESPSADRKPILDIKTKQKILERKQSFEGGEIFRQKSYEKKEVISPRDRGSVLETVKALTELDAKAKAQPTIVRRTKSLPMDNLDDSVEYEDIANYYDIVGMKHADDVSNEGDISSEADLYEVIPANMAVDNSDLKKGYKDRRGPGRGTAYMKKRRRASDEQSEETDNQTGAEGDLDSDSDSSGIYEHVDHTDDDDGRISESDSVDNQSPPELPPARVQSAAKKKKTKDEKSKGFRGRIKKLYKGKSMDTESALKAAAGPGLATASSAGLMSSIGDKLKKNLKKNKSSSGTNLVAMNKEDNPVCESDGTDTDFDPNSPRSKPDEPEDQSLAPPPLPPRQSGLFRASSGAELTKSNSTEAEYRLSTPDSVYTNNRKSSSSNLETKDPPLPPRNRISSNLDLNVVIPVHPGGEGRKSGWAPSKDSYLLGQKFSNSATSPEIPYIDQSPSPKSTSSTDVPPLPQRPAPSKRPTNPSVSSYLHVNSDQLLHKDNILIPVELPG